MSGPPESVVRWAARSWSSNATVMSVVGLRAGDSPWLLRMKDGDDVRSLILKTGDPGQQPELATEVAALSLAKTSGLAAPRLVAADLTGDDAGGLAVLFTVVDGGSDIPLECSLPRLRAAGAAAAAIHRVRLEPSEHLPVRRRHMPWIDFSAMRRAGDSGEESTPLLEEADELARVLREPEDGMVLVHGDLWQGNLMWAGDELTGVIDWEAAGAGSSGVDLGSLRLDVALVYGVEFVDEILLGWQDARGRPAENVAYWDLVAAVNTPADMTGFLPTMHEAGRIDLDGPKLTDRRDRFLESALARL